ncbi:helicase-associated domain-containing protein [Paenibacillus alvei]|uniref:helicase-associated domain-containing protein n=1 Tax=Paenibacillus alvei TaxID=44250 RepID=UPI003D283117
MNTYQLWKRMEQNKEHSCSQQWQKFSDNPVQIVEAYAALPEEHRASYDVMFNRTATLPFALDALRKWHGPMATGAMLRAACGPLLKSGLLASVRTTWGERLFFIPKDVYECLLAFQLDRMDLENVHQSKGTKSGDEWLYSLQPLDGSNVISVESSKGMLRDLFQLLVYALNEGLPLTAKGVLHKRAISRLDSLLCLHGQAFAGWDVKIPFAESMPIHVAIVLDTALRLGLLRKDATSYTVENDQLKRWLNLPSQEALRTIAEVVIEHYLPNEALIRHVAYAVLHFGRMGKWSSEEIVGHACRDLGWLAIGNVTFDTVRQQIKEWLRTSHALGLCDVGEADDCWMFRTVYQEEDAEQRVLFVQPDFEIMVPPHASFLIRFELEVFAQLWNSDQMDTYRLTRESFENGLEHGRSVQSVLSFLESCSLTGVPDQVRDAIEMWGRQYGRIQFSEVVLLRCADSDTAQAVQSAMESSEVLRNWLVPISSEDYIVDRDHVDEVESQLIRFELPPLKRWGGEERRRMPKLWQDGNHGQVAEEADLKGPVYSPSSLQYYEMDTGLLVQDAEEASYNDISGQWTKALRSYHTSTKRDMVMAAIRHQTQLEVEEAGRSQVIVPLTSTSSDDLGWAITAYVLPCLSSDMPVQLSPEKWDRVRLIVPEGLL